MYLDFVNKVYLNILSYLMLLSFVATLIPFNILHHHDVASHCSDIDVEIENTPCHISTYHEESKKDKCKHKHHITDVQEVCKFCKVLRPNRHHNLSIDEYQSTIISIFVSQDISLRNESLRVLNLCHSFLGRAPPVA